MNQNSVDAYIASAPEEMREKLQSLRALIKQSILDAEEKMSYGMPFYAYKGRVVYFALNKNHIGLYIPPPTIEQHATELKNYGTTKSAVHLPLTGELPKGLITKLVTARVRWNESKTS